MKEVEVVGKPFSFLVFASLLLAAVPAATQDYPNRPIRLIVPFSPGGFIDVLARQFGEQLSRRVGQPVIVENRPGRGGMIGSQAVEQSSADGYTLLWGASGASDPRDLRPVAEVASFPHVLIVPESLGIKSVAGFISHARANPRRLSFAAIPGSPSHLMGGIFKNLVGIDITFIPYKSFQDAMTDLITDRAQMQFSPVAQAQPHIASGRLRALALTGEQRLNEPTELRDVPTLKESGYPNFPPGTWSGVLSPSNTPRDIVERLNSAINQVLAANEFKARVQRMGGLVTPGSAEDFSRAIQQRSKLWSELIRMCPECTDVNCTSPKKPCSYDTSICCDPK